MDALAGEDVVGETDVSEGDVVWTVLVDGWAASFTEAVERHIGTLVMTATRSDFHPLLDNDSTKYVPYTPRQRTPAKPPLASLRAAAQNIGLDANSVGWAILEKISYEGEEWPEIWSALTKARVRLVAAPARACSSCVGDAAAPLGAEP